MCNYRKVARNRTAKNRWKYWKNPHFLLVMMQIFCQTAHCGRHKPRIDFGELAFPTVPYRHLPQTLRKRQIIPRLANKRL